MCFISIDLGTTNIKVAVYDKELNTMTMNSTNMHYDRNEVFVEFDAEDYYLSVVKTIKDCCKDSGISLAEKHQIILTGQAESLVIIGKDGSPLRKAISWLDERSTAECAELSRHFDNDTCFKVTGQVSIIPTWPITKMLWLKKHEPDVFAEVYKFMLLKDYIQFRLTNTICGELSIYNFSLYFDIHNKCYWKEILDVCGVCLSQLPDLIEPCTNIGAVTAKAASELGLSQNTTVNVGTLDHFAGMIGTGNIEEGIVSESTGTVLSIATMLGKEAANASFGIPCHYGPFKDTYVLLSVCESGGVSLEWFTKQFDISFKELNEELALRKRPSGLLFLPHLTGTNAPDYNSDAKGVFYGLQLSHDKYDMALAVMEGVAHMLARNIIKMQESGINIKKIISTGGGARSDIWSEIKASINDCAILVPKNEEAACLGAAIIGAINEGVYSSYKEAIEKKVSIAKTFSQSNINEYQKQHIQFCKLFNSLVCMFSECA